jgi:hypothetical protein
MKVTEFIKFRTLQWAGHVIKMAEHRVPKKVLQQQIHCNRRIGKHRMLVGIRAGKTKPKDTESRRKRIEEANARYVL